jgi:DNA helicase-2/ATP-dependent DNA helicase PcrA
MDDASKVFSQAWDEADLQDDFVSTSAVQQEISRAKNALIGPLEYQAGVDQPVGRVVEKVFPLYQQKLLACNAVDFDDLLLWIAVILQESEELRQQLDRRFAYIMVDEYQDTNLAQYAIVRSLSNLYPNLAVTGDPDQSIYGWRGANIGNILGFERDYPQVKVVRLEQNYRSTQSILRVADRLIVNNRQRKAKRLVPTLEVGQAVRVKVSSQPQDEARWIATEIRGILDERIWEPQDIAVFYRANWLSRNLEHEFNSAGIPYQLVNGFEFYQRKEVKDLVAYLRLLANPLNDIALERVINSPSRKIGKVTLDRIRDVARQRKIAMLEACQASLADARSLGRGAAAVATFVGQIAKLQQEPWDSVRHLLEAVLRVTGYGTVLEADRSETSSERLGNVNELLVAADEFD